ncbi:ABC transporter transmembrane domain-containing protein [Cellulomonas denverensis]|uniref:ABC transporter transmembrane domain-containing protein n=1 Tax=Cellulomonas denverensis TaxID=264297 RepID=UPI0035E732BC
MRPLPEPEPGHPPLTGPWAYLRWLSRRQLGVLLGATVMAIIGNVAAAMQPLALGIVVDDGLTHGLSSGLWSGCLLLFALGMTQVGTNVWGHRLDVENWLRAALGSSQQIGHHVTRTGDAVTETLPTGEVVATVASDALRMGEVFHILPRLIGGIVAYLTLGVVLLTISTPLGLLVLLGLPVVVAVLSLLVPPLQRRQAAQREATGRLTTLGADTVSGLRILRGIGGEEVFSARYREQSQKVRGTGVAVAQTQSFLDALQTLLPGLFLAVVVWSGARLAIAGEITPRPAGVVLRLRGLPDPAAVDRQRGDPGDHPRAGRCPQDPERAAGAGGRPRRPGRARALPRGRPGAGRPALRPGGPPRAAAGRGRRRPGRHRADRTAAGPARPRPVRRRRPRPVRGDVGPHHAARTRADRGPRPDRGRRVHPRTCSPAP